MRTPGSRREVSVTQCRSCDQPITFVLRDDGRWRPVEVTFEELTAEGDELLAIQKTGSWLAIAGTVRVYKAHRCIEDPSWNRGRPAMRPGTESYAAAPVPTRACTHCGIVDDHDDDECPTVEALPGRDFVRATENALRKMSQAMQYVLLYDCIECGAPKGEPCQSVGGWPIPMVCIPRKLRAAFGEGQLWPPRNNQIGYVQLKGWLSEHASILTSPPTGA